MQQIKLNRLQKRQEIRAKRGRSAPLVKIRGGFKSNSAVEEYQKTGGKILEQCQALLSEYTPVKRDSNGVRV